MSLLINAKFRVKHSKRISNEIEVLTEADKSELRKLGVNPNGLFHLLEPEAVKLGKDYAEIYVGRYVKSGKKVKETDPKKFDFLVKKGRYYEDGSLPYYRKKHQLRMGLTEVAFELFLQQIIVAHVPNQPIIDWRDKFLFDCHIPLFGKIDIKSATMENPNVSINCREFKKENPAFIIAYLIIDLEHIRWLKLVGFLSKKEIEKYKPIPNGYRTYWKIPLRDFEKHDGEELYHRLKAIKKQLDSMEDEKSNSK